MRRDVGTLDVDVEAVELFDGFEGGLGPRVVLLLVASGPPHRNLNLTHAEHHGDPALDGHLHEASPIRAVPLAERRRLRDVIARVPRQDHVAGHRADRAPPRVELARVEDDERLTKVLVRYLCGGNRRLVGFVSGKGPAFLHRVFERELQVSVVLAAGDAVRRAPHVVSRNVVV